MKSYYDIAVALINWEESGRADSEFNVIMDWFEDWISRGTDIRNENGKLTTMLKDWQKVFATPYKNRITAIKTGASTVKTRVATVSSKVDAIKKSICQNKACTGKTASTYLNNG
jgi:archaellum component FlaC